jgi:hypothetical protein
MVLAWCSMSQPLFRKVVILRLCGYQPKDIQKRCAIAPGRRELKWVIDILRWHGKELTSGRYVLNEALPKGQVYTNGRRHPIEWISEKGLSPLVNPIGAVYEQPLLLQYYVANGAFC